MTRPLPRRTCRPTRCCSEWGQRAARAWRESRSGWLPCGPKGFSGRLEFRRNEQPTLFWLMFLVYGVAGIALIVFALRLLTGSAEPLPLN
jgi:hypothetical protein